MCNKPISGRHLMSDSNNIQSSSSLFSFIYSKLNIDSSTCITVDKLPTQQQKQNEENYHLLHLIIFALIDFFLSQPQQNILLKKVHTLYMYIISTNENISICLPLYSYFNEIYCSDFFFFFFFRFSIWCLTFFFFLFFLVFLHCCP